MFANALYAGWTLGGPLLQTWTDGASWTADTVFLAFHELSFPSASPPPNPEDLTLWEWRGVLLPNATPGVSGD